MREATRVAGVLGLLVAAVLAILWPGAAHASGDIGCMPGWKLRHHDFTGCDSMAMLSPGNDTRVNLTLLLARIRRPAPRPRDGERFEPLFDWATYAKSISPSMTTVGDQSYAAGEGSRCLSDEGGTAAFAMALGDARQVSDAERGALIAARRGLKPSCTDAGKGAAAIASVAAQARSPVEQAYANYLEGTAAFYAGDFDAAAARFAALAGARDPWLRETALYMLGRVEVNRAQVGLFDEYGSRDEQRHPDPRTIAAADTRLHAYLRAYPAGRYSASAQGLLRRVYWLGGDTAKLAAAYVALFAKPVAARGLDDVALAEEIDTKLLPQLTAADTSDPTLLAVIDLEAMRGDDAHPAKSALSRAALQAQRPRFAQNPALFEHLIAAYAFYVQGNPREVLALIPDAARQPTFDTVQFSRQMMRGMALDAVGDRNARGFWVDLMPGAAQPFQRTAVELALALHDERDRLERVFAPGSPVHNPAIRDMLLTNVAGPQLLRRQVTDTEASAHERIVALFTLLYKDITRGAYRDFVGDVGDVGDVGAVPPGASDKTDIYEFVGIGDPPLGIFTKAATGDGFACPAPRDIAVKLAANPRDAAAQLCIGEFVRLNNLDGFFLDSRPPADELGGTATRFPGPPMSRLDIYRAVIAAPATPPADRAYALFRAINCYAPSRSNECGGKGVEPAVRKAWFVRLHNDFAASRWARESRYYW